ncbi:1,4-alpha-glucan branching enzyme [Tolypothrix campylonemoides VB511288]|nr:1,4-alpha-glucan branching enzyme [Tolypothrix campylonemoides VB511288]
MYENFGPQVEGNNITFKLFFPDKAKDPSQYTRGGLPQIKKIQVVGTFQKHLKPEQKDWDIENAPEMILQDHSKGMLYTFSTTLPDDFYEYKFYVTFNDDSTRRCNDPCTKYSGQDPNSENSGFVVGGKKVENVKPIANRLPPGDLIIYELMIDDFTEKLLENSQPGEPPKARLDFIKDKIQYLKDLGINAVEFMPWTAVLGRDFGWGYNPYLFFSVEDRFTNANSDVPEEKLNRLYRLKELIEALHGEDIHVIMDGVFNHADKGDEQRGGFPYYWLYRNPDDSPYCGPFASPFLDVDLNYQNQCTQEFIFDVCKYWLDVYQIDGIRFDFTLGYFLPDGGDNGIAKLIDALRKDFERLGRENISLTIEHLTEPRYLAIDVTSRIHATGCWFDPFMFKAFEFGNANTVNTSIMRAMDTHRDFTPGSGPTVYIENHDHGTIVNKVGGSRLGADVRPNNWFKTQPYAIALLTLPSTILIHNGQELGDEYFLPDDVFSGRVISRPVNWDNLNDSIGQTLFGIYKKLIQIRKNHPSLRSPNFYPSFYNEGDIYFNNEGYGVHEDKKIVIYHRWGNGLNGQLERFIIVLNFSASEQFVDIPFPLNGVWKDLLNDEEYTVTNNRLFNQKINSHWGRILHAKG